MLTARTQVKEVTLSAGVDNISADFMDRLDEKVKQMIIEACQRAKENNRKTVMGRDI